MPAEPDGSEFSPAQLEAVIQNTENGLNSLVNAANSFIGHTESSMGWIPAIGNDIKAMLDRFGSLVQEFVKKVQIILTQSHVPVIMWEYANIWGPEGIAGQLGQISVDLSNSSDWHGDAGKTYKAAVSGQADAATAVQNKANTIADACKAVAQAGFGFYAAVAVAVASAISACLDGPIGVGLAIGSLVAAVGGLLFANEVQAQTFQSAGEPVKALNGPTVPTVNGPLNGWPQAALPLPQVGL